MSVSLHLVIDEGKIVINKFPNPKSSIVIQMFICITGMDCEVLLVTLCSLTFKLKAWTHV